jgi:hypothetical protein
LTCLSKYDLVSSDCGIPELPESTKINSFKSRYAEHSYVQYECDSNNKELIGDISIQCINGKWEGNTPKCGETFTFDSFFSCIFSSSVSFLASKLKDN